MNQNTKDYFDQKFYMQQNDITLKKLVNNQKSALGLAPFNHNAPNTGNNPVRGSSNDVNKLLRTPINYRDFHDAGSVSKEFAYYSQRTKEIVIYNIENPNSFHKDVNVP